MALDSQSIEKRDFPIGRRGYEPDAVDAHLRRLAEEVEILRDSSERSTDTLATAASEQVRAIVEAAETSAAQIERAAEAQARSTIEGSQQDASSTRDRATEQARERVTAVSAATATMLERVDAMEGELSGLIESLRTGANRLTADLALLAGNLGELEASAVSSPRTSAAPSASGAERPFDDHEDDRASRAPAADTGAGEADEGARLIALNMALNGSPRHEVDSYLAENFQLGDREGLLDEVYSSVE